MTTVAMPVFRSRIAPVFDCSHQVLLVNLERNREVNRTELHLKGLSLAERVVALASLGVTTIICAGISEALCTMFKSSGVSVIWGVTGSVDDVFAAFMNNRLDEPRFCMPGRTWKRIKAHSMSEPGIKHLGNKDTKTTAKKGEHP